MQKITTHLHSILKPFVFAFKFSSILLFFVFSSYFFSCKKSDAKLNEFIIGKWVSVQTSWQHITGISVNTFFENGQYINCSNGCDTLNYHITKGFLYLEEKTTQVFIKNKIKTLNTTKLVYKNPEGKSTEWQRI